MAIEAHKAQIGNTQRRRFARSPQSALCPVCTADFLPGFNDPLLTGVNVKGATFNRNAQIDSQQVGKGGTFFNGQSQIGTQKDIGLGGLGFINKGSQVQLQFGRGKREAQFHNIGSSIGTIVGLEGSTFLNQNSQIDQAHASAGASVTGVGSQYRHQQGYTNDQQLLTLLGRRKKREAQFTNIGSGVGTQVGHAGSSFTNLNSQINTQLGAVGSHFGNQASQIQIQKGLGGTAQLPSISTTGSGHIFNLQSQIGSQFGGRKKREAQFFNIDSGIGTQIGLSGSSFTNQGGQVSSQLGALGSNFKNLASQIGTQQGIGSLGLGSIPQLPTGGSGHIFNKQSQINTQIGG